MELITPLRDGDNQSAVVRPSMEIINYCHGRSWYIREGKVKDPTRALSSDSWFANVRHVGIDCPFSEQVSLVTGIGGRMEHWVVGIEVSSNDSSTGKISEPSDIIYGLWRAGLSVAD